MLQESRPLGEPAKGGVLRGLRVGVGQLRQPMGALGDLPTGGWRRKDALARPLRASGAQSCNVAGGVVERAALLALTGTAGKCPLRHTVVYPSVMLPCYAGVRH